MTRAELIIDLKKLIGPGIEVDDAGLGTWLNDAYMQMVEAISEVNPEVFAKASTADTVAGQQEYDLPTDFERVLMVNILVDGSWRRVRYVSINDVSAIANADAQGYSWDAPGFYIVGDNIGFLPIPASSGDETIKLWYVATPTELTLDSDAPAIPKKYHHILKYGAYANYLDQDDEHVAAENMRRRFDKLVERMVESMSQNQIDQPKAVQITNDTDLYYTDEEGY